MGSPVSMLDLPLPIASDTVEGIIVAVIGAVALLGGTWLQNRKTRQLNSSEHGVSTEVLREIRDEQREMKADVRDAKDDIRLIKNEATVVRDRLTNLERKEIREVPPSDPR